MTMLQELPLAAERRRSLVELLLVLAGAVAAVGAVLQVPVVVVAGIAAGLLVVAAVRFELFVLAALVLRASLDVYKGDSVLSPATALGAAVLVLVFGNEVLSRLRGEGRRRLAAPFRWPLQVLVAAAALSALLSDDVVGSGTEVLRLSAVLAMVVALERTMGSPGSERRVLIAVLVSAPVPLALALVQAAQGEGRLIAGFSRITGSFLHPTPFSIYLALLIVTAVALLPHVAPRLRWGLGLLSAVACVCLLLTYTRASWIALVAGLLVVGFLQSRRLALTVVVGAVVAVLALPSVGQRFADLEAPVRYSGATSNSLVWRVDYWREIVQLSDRSPVVGIGLKGIERSTEGAKNAHNDLVRTYVETGVVGLLAYLALAVSLVVTALRGLRAGSSGWRRGAAVGLAGAVTVLAVVSVTSNVITQVVLLWYVVALSMITVSTTQHDTTRAAGDRGTEARVRAEEKGTRT